MPRGRVRGIPIVAPGSRFGPAASRAGRLVWQGKIFRDDGATAVNRFFGVRAVRGKVSHGPSWVDGRPSLLLDYRGTSLVYGRYRDEIREVAPGAVPRRDVRPHAAPAHVRAVLRLRDPALSLGRRSNPDFPDGPSVSAWQLRPNPCNSRDCSPSSYSDMLCPKRPGARVGYRAGVRTAEDQPAARATTAAIAGRGWAAPGRRHRRRPAWASPQPRPNSCGQSGRSGFSCEKVLARAYGREKLARLRAR